MAKIQDGPSPDPWKGEYWGKFGAVNTAYYDYHVECHFKASAEKARVNYVSVLYSAFASVLPKALRLHPIALGRAVTCLARLRPFMQEYESVARKDHERLLALSNDAKEVLGAVLFRYASVPLVDSAEYIVAAKTYALEAYQRSLNTQEHHTCALAALTLARISEQCDGSADVPFYLRTAEQKLPNITDPNQKARVLRSLADVSSRQSGGREAALAYFAELDQMPDLPADVKAKNAEMRRKLKL